MASLNKCSFIGNLTKEPMARYLPNGDAVSSFSIAINENYKDKAGVKQEKTEFVNIVVFRKLADICNEYLKVGQQVYIEGKISTRKWEKDGITRYSTEIIADEMQMLGSKAQNNSTGNDSYQKENAPQSKVSVFDDFEDDIPFN